MNLLVPSIYETVHENVLSLNVNYEKYKNRKHGC